MLKVDRVEFLLSAVKPDQFLPPDRPEIAFSGRSNVGKSSLLNLLVRRKSIAKVSRTPGKTRAVNFFDVEGQWRLVDLPGYGYARLSQNEIADWGHVIDTYLRERSNLWVVVQLIDSRHKPTQLDMEMMGWLAHSGMPTIIALTKVDKLNQNDRRAVVNKFQKEWLGDLDWPVVATSADHKVGREELLSILEEYLEAAWKSGKFDAATNEVESAPTPPPLEVEDSLQVPTEPRIETSTGAPRPPRGRRRASARQKPPAGENPQSPSSSQKTSRPRRAGNRGKETGNEAKATPASRPHPGSRRGGKAPGSSAAPKKKGNRPPRRRRTN
jgi:GTP-binding protein